LAYIDLDNFKGINDHFGHSVGDAVLKELVSIMHEHTRGSDLVGRLGGDEFAIFYTETDAQAALQAMRKLRAHVKERADKSQWPVSISAGMITVEEGACDLMDILKRADNLMYTVKGEGKNNVRQETITSREN
jgi:diguanylate cyclase (GGDEF)-like protein